MPPHSLPGIRNICVHGTTYPSPGPPAFRVTTTNLTVVVTSYPQVGWKRVSTEFMCDFRVTLTVILSWVQLDWLTGDRSLGRVSPNPNVDFSTAPQGTCPHNLTRREALIFPAILFGFPPCALDHRQLGVRQRSCSAKMRPCSAPCRHDLTLSSSPARRQRHRVRRSDPAPRDEADEDRGYDQQQ
jgi:hypothetical protein